MAKICTKCGLEKPLSDFSLRNKEKNTYQSLCKKCSKEYKKLHYKKHKKELDIKTLNYNKNHPWIKIYIAISYRCNNPNSPAYKGYGGRGIKNLFKDSEEIKFLMERDGYWNMKRPSIDRIDNDGNYCLENCRFIEQSTHSKKTVNENQKRILQFDKNGKFIYDWYSAKDAAKNLNISVFGIWACCQNKQKTSSGFIWRYKC
jgi:hypothetical protein